MSVIFRFFRVTSSKYVHLSMFVSVKEKLAQDPDNEIATTSLRISLLCPVRLSLVDAH